MRLDAYLGADPGMGGALALYVLVDGRTEIHVEDMPSLELNGKRRMDHWKLSQVLAAWTSIFAVRHATIERVHAMPLRGPGGQIRQSAPTLFEFGFAAGALVQAVASAGIPLTLVHPATWKTVYGLRGGRENKDMSRSKASQMFPNAAHNWPLKKHDGRAEAVLLAHYGSKLQNAHQ